MAGERVLLDENGRLWPLWASPAPFALGSLALLALGRGGNAAALALVGAVLWLSFVLPLVVSRRRYSRVTLLPTELRVGRDRFQLDALDLDSLREQADGKLVTKRPDDVLDCAGCGYEMAGGPWGPTPGERHLQLRLRENGALVAVGSSHPDRLARRILEAAAR